MTFNEAKNEAIKTGDAAGGMRLVYVDPQFSFGVEVTLPPRATRIGNYYPSSYTQPGWTFADGLDVGTVHEIERNLRAGMRMVSLFTLDSELRALGYDRTVGSRCAGRFTDCNSGETYAGVTWGVHERDSKLSAFNVDARRDDNFNALQELRRNTFVFNGKEIVTV